MMSTRQYLRRFSGSLFHMNGNLVKKECLNALILEYEWTQPNNYIK